MIYKQLLIYHNMTSECASTLVTKVNDITEKDLLQGKQRKIKF